MKEFSYQFIANSIYKDFIIGKQLNPHDAIPTEQFLMDHYNVSRTTIRKAIHELIVKDLVYSVQGSGTFVKLERHELKISHLDNFSEYATSILANPTTLVTKFEIILASREIASLLHIDLGTAVYYTNRVRSLDNEPVLIEIGYMPVALFPDLTFEIMSKSKYDYIEKQKSLIIKNSHVYLEPVLLDKESAEILGTIPNIPAICIKSQSFLDNGTLFEYTEVIRNPNKYKIMIETQRRK